MQYVVPQFIEVESKIIGPISVRQFVILLVTAGIIWLEWTLLTFWLAAVIGVLSLALGVIFAFAKINGQPFHIFALSLLQTMKSPRLKLWKKELKLKIVNKKPKKVTNKTNYTPKPPMSQSRLTELALMVDTGGIYQSQNKEKK